MSTPVSADDLARVLYKPTLYRGVLALVFAAVGIFAVKNPSPVLLSAALGLLWLLTALFMWPVTRLGGLPSVLRTGWTGAVLAWAVAGILAFFVREPAALAAMGALGLGLGGVCEAVAGARTRGIGRPTKDAVISGGVGILGAVILVAVAAGMGTRVDVHGVFGTLAMIVAVLGVHLVLAGLGYRHDAARRDDAA